MLHVPKKDGRFAAMSVADRIAHLGAKTISTDAVKEVVEIGELLWEDAKCFPEGGGAFVVGETRAGKSTAVAEFADVLFERLKSEKPDGNWFRPKTTGTPIRGIAEILPDKGFHRPLACVFVDTKPTFKSLMKNTATEMGIVLKSNFTFDDAMTAVKHHVEQQKIKMIIFDEVQHIVKGQMTYDAADVLKIMCKAGLQVFCVGLPEAIILRTVNEQLGELVAHEHLIGPFECSFADFETKEKTPYRKFLAALDNKKDPLLPFDEPSNLADPEMALRLYRATGGYIGRLMRLLRSATQLAARRGLSHLGPAVLADAYRHRTRCNDDRNWFLMGWPAFVKGFDLTDPEPAPDQNEPQTGGGKRSPSGDNPLRRKSRH